MTFDNIEFIHELPLIDVGRTKSALIQLESTLE